MVPTAFVSPVVFPVTADGPPRRCPPTCWWPVKSAAPSFPTMPPLRPSPPSRRLARIAAAVAAALVSAAVPATAVPLHDGTPDSLLSQPPPPSTEAAVAAETAAAAARVPGPPRGLPPTVAGVPAGSDLARLLGGEGGRGSPTDPRAHGR